MVAERALGGEPWRLAARDFLDDFGRAVHEERQVLLDDEPPPFDEVSDAYLAALAEHLAYHHGLVRPAWCATASVRMTTTSTC